MRSSLTTAGLIAFASLMTGAAVAMPLAPHRAAYELTLASVKNKSVSGASGRMALEMTGNACEGYASTFRLLTQIANEEGQSRISELLSTSYEGGDGKTLRFNTITRMNNVLAQTTEGTAERGQDGGLAIALSRPARTKLDMDGDALFPTEHTLRLIAAAQKGERVLEVKVYDGSDGGEKVYDTTAMIGAEVPPSGRPAEVEAKKVLGEMRRWPVSISYFAPGAGERTPTYVITMDMYENGVSGAVRMDFGDFVLKGELRRLELLKGTDCKK